MKKFNKKVGAIAVTAVLGLTLVAVGGATTALAATNEGKLNEIKDLYSQIFGIQQQIVEKQAEAGTITKEQADIMKKNLELQQEYQSQVIDNGQFYGGIGYGMMGGGYGYGMSMMGGYGMMNGYDGYGMMSGYGMMNGYGGNGMMGGY